MDEIAMLERVGNLANSLEIAGRRIAELEAKLEAHERNYECYAAEIHDLQSKLGTLEQERADWSGAVQALRSQLDDQEALRIAAETRLDSAGIEKARMLADYNEMIANNHIMSKRLEAARQAWKVLSDPAVDQHTEARRLDAHQRLWDAIKPGVVERREKLIEDGFGMQASKCDRPDCGLHVVRPGKIACDVCPRDEQWEKGVFGTDERYVRVADSCLMCGKYHGEGVPCPEMQDNSPRL